AAIGTYQSLVVTGRQSDEAIIVEVQNTEWDLLARCDTAGRAIQNRINQLHSRLEGTMTVERRDAKDLIERTSVEVPKSIETKVAHVARQFERASARMRPAPGCRDPRVKCAARTFCPYTLRLVLLSEHSHEANWRRGHEQVGRDRLHTYSFHNRTIPVDW